MLLAMHTEIRIVYSLSYWIMVTVIMQEENRGIMQADHQRTVVWTFEDLHMLIGTDLPIFGGNTHPCVSLRLR